MDNQNIEAKILDIFSKYTPLEVIKYSMSIMTDLRIDSLSYIAIITEIENIFNIQLEEEDLSITAEFTLSELGSIIQKGITKQSVITGMPSNSN